MLPNVLPLFAVESRRAKMKSGPVYDHRRHDDTASRRSLACRCSLTDDELVPVG
jgi:hypothetical protein